MPSDIGFPMTLTSGAFINQKPTKQTSHEQQKSLDSTCFSFCTCSKRRQFIAQNAYCSRDIYFQFTKVRRTVILRAVTFRRYENSSTIGCKERTTMLINIMYIGGTLNKECGTLLF